MATKLEKWEAKLEFLRVKLEKSRVKLESRFVREHSGMAPAAVDIWLPSWKNGMPSWNFCRSSWRNHVLSWNLEISALKIEGVTNKKRFWQQPKALTTILSIISKHLYSLIIRRVERMLGLSCL